jgi:glycosyltransferase involved in cell wall biosynthesis
MRFSYHRVAIVTTSYPSHEHDWVGHFVRAEALELARSGARVTVLTTRAAFDGDVGSGVRAVNLGGSAAFGPPGAVARMAAFPPRALAAALWASRVHGTLRRESFDRVIAHWAIPSAWPVALGTRAPLEIVSHGTDVRVLVRMPRRVLAVIASSLAAHAECWRFVSDELRDALLARLDDDLASRVARIAIVRAQSVAMPNVAARAEEIRGELGAFRVSVGRLVASKRVDKAIDHAARHRELLVVVGDGPERATLERHATRASARVRFVGDLPRDEALAYVAAADALVFASEAEGNSTVLHEARSLATRVDVL